jgi:hypothetical protein
MSLSSPFLEVSHFLAPLTLLQKPFVRGSTGVF